MGPESMDSFLCQLQDVRGLNLIGPFLTKHMISCMLTVYIVLLQMQYDGSEIEIE